MPGDISIAIRDVFGEQTATLEGFTTASYARGLHVVGSGTFEIPDDAYSPSLFPIDGRFEFWRKVEGASPRLDTDTAFFIRRRRRKRHSDGSVTRIISGPSAVDILDRRIVAYAAGIDQAITQNDPADNAMKVITRQNLGDLAPTSPPRQISSTYFSVAAAESLGPIMSKRYARRNLLELLREISGETLLSTPVFFDVVRKSDAGFEFRTYVGQRGTDRTSQSAAPVVFSSALGNLAEEELDENYEDELTVVYAGGSGEGQDRLTRVATDTMRSARSPFGRREGWVDARDATKSGEVDADARAGLAAGRPKLTVSGDLISTPEYAYGRHWGFGDKLTAEVFDVILDAYVNAVSVSIDTKGEETVTGKVLAVDVSA